MADGVLTTIKSVSTLFKAPPKEIDLDDDEDSLSYFAKLADD